jgi:hydrogenase-4 component H
VLLSKLRQALICLLAGKVTLSYPAKPRPPEEGFRGYPEVDVNKCIGCGACAAVCPARLIKIEDVDQTTRRMTRLLERCVFCGRCAEVCPEDAITMSKQFELTSDQARQDLTHVCEVFMATCKRCGRCYEPATPLDRIMKPGFRHDQIDRGGDRCPYPELRAPDSESPSTDEHDEHDEHLDEPVSAQVVEAK